MSSTTATLKTERFEVAFNQIHQQLRVLVKNETPRFTNLVYKGAKKYSLIRTYQEELHQLGKLRNAIVHDRYDVGKYIAEPHEETVQRIEKIAEIFTRPEEALSIATKQVICFNYTDSIKKVIQGIQTYSYSQYPIYHEGYCIGLLTAKAIVKWMATNITNGIIKMEQIKVKDIYDHQSEPPLSFASKSINLFDIEEIFAIAHKQKQDLEAVIITETGRKDEQPLGVITPWDLIEIDYSLNL